ncbi:MULTISPECIES: TIGR02530 family flagellar biosynthesis protein [Paenibacillus]|uniref:Flagellar biosynthesis protein n=1 Tax=Paenibacillus radicis (ex Xue et al. 2023) TaxID=2972489 RepID=A0ABT1YF03_9BACL|nr:TIGR02530 family flagellar biosynthesis protein [Paenibacillus radicis (ex Xue et al. 2023)]MCR8630808.1 flagellar biosynthesis protein [Paenibacillus radicis (ex Xue et al. 2023)]
MTERISVGQLYPGSLRTQQLKRNDAPAPAKEGTFQNVLQNELVRFSHHAEQRLRQRGIEFQPEQLAKIQSAIDKAASKGAKDSLMLINDTALIVNIKNRTVVTALDEASMKDNLFTQIDSAVIIS